MLSIFVGTLFMIIGDLFFSYTSDKYGPKWPTLVGSILQIFSMILLLKCNTFVILIFTEIVLGFSFPAIYGASLKWLIFFNNGYYEEKNNQTVFWFSQFFSSVVGCFLYYKDMYLFSIYITLILYFLGFFICLFLPNTQKNYNHINNLQEKEKHLNHKKNFVLKKAIFLFLPCVLFGVSSCFPYIIQDLISIKLLLNNKCEFIFYQISFPLITFLGTVIKLKMNSFQINFFIFVLILTIFLIIIKIFVLSIISSYIIILYRGIIGVKLRENFVLNVSRYFGVSKSNSFFNVSSKIFQSIFTVFVSKIL